MKHFLFSILCLLLLAVSCNPKHLKTQPEFKENNLIDSDSISKDQFIFPDDWLGYWSGDLKIYNSKGLKQVVPMSLDLSKTETKGVYTWAIIYGQDSTAQRRDYQLKEIDSSIGHYLIDEKNGILIDAYLIHNELNSIFEVMGNTILTSYALENNEMIFSVKMFLSTEVRISGDTIVNNEEIPKVKSYQHSISQVARLQKKCLVE